MKLSEFKSLRRGAAVHEAGHAVVASALGLKVRRLQIRKDGSGASCIERSAHLPILDQVAVAEAGMAAVELLKAPTSPQAGLADAAEIMDILDGYPNDQFEHLTAKGRERARKILADRQAILVALADALNRDGLLGATALIPLLS